MKKNELKQMIREELGKIVSEGFKIRDRVIPKIGPHKGVEHEVIYVFPNGKINIKPIGLTPKQIKYKLGATTAEAGDVEKA